MTSSSGIWAWLAHRAGIEPGQIGRLRALCILHFAVICGFTLVKAAREGLYLSYHSVRELPLLYLVMALAGSVATWGISRATQRLRDGEALAWEIGGSAVVFLALYFAVHRWTANAGVLLYLWAGIYGALLVAKLWSAAGTSFTSREAKSAFGLISAAGVLGGLVGSGLVIAAHWFWLPAEYLLLPATIVHLAVLPAAIRLRPRWTNDTEREDSAGFLIALKAARSMPYLRILFLVFLLGGAVSAMIDYELRLFIQRDLPPDSSAISSFMGKLFLAQNVFALVIQLGVTRFLLDRWGARAIATSLPALILGLALAMPFAPGLLVLIALRLTDSTLRASAVGTSWEFLLFPIPPSLRSSIRRILGAITQRLAEGVAGLVLLAAGVTATSHPLPATIALILVSALWLFFDLLLSRQYFNELRGMLLRESKAKDPQLTPAEPFAIESALGLERIAQRNDLRDAGAVQALARNHMDRIRSCSSWLESMGALPDPKSRAILVNALETRLGQAFDGLCALLIRGSFSKNVSGRLLVDEDPRVRAHCSEYLHTVLSRSDHRRLTLLADGVARARSSQVRTDRHVERARDCVDALDELARDPRDGWLRCCAIFAIGQLRLVQLRPVLEAVAVDDGSIADEATRWALLRLDQSPISPPPQLEARLRDAAQWAS